MALTRSTTENQDVLMMERRRDVLRIRSPAPELCKRDPAGVPNWAILTCAQRIQTASTARIYSTSPPNVDLRNRRSEVRILSGALLRRLETREVSGLSWF